VVSDLAASGYRVRWDCIPASAVGAPHQRDRLWIVAHARGRRRDGRTDEQGQGPPRRMRAGEGRDALAHAPMLLGETIFGCEPNGILSKDVPDATKDGRRKGRPG
jgi:site-specific DNA-cytosine methylase